MTSATSIGWIKSRPASASGIKTSPETAALRSGTP
jgi:hypothetical protein